MYLESHLSRVSRNALLWAAAILGLLSFWLGHDWQTVANALEGPCPVSTASLVQPRSPDVAWRSFIAVTPEDAGIEVGNEESVSNGRSTATARYVLMKCAGSLLLVKQPPTGSTGRQVGVLTAIPSDVASNIYNPVVAQASTAGLSVLPFMLDTSTNFRPLVIGWLITAVVVAALAVWWMVTSIIRLSNVARHPVLERLAGQYPSGTAVLSIDQEIDAEYGAERPRGVALTSSWLINPRHLRVGVYRLEDLTWVYKKVTRHFVNFFPTGKTYAVVLHDRAGRAHEVQCNRDEEYANDILIGITERVPGIRTGYTQARPSLS
jgi:hypothetical protein